MKDDKKIDLHIHSIFSDGTLPPYEVVKTAKIKGLSAISITDHDEIRGIEPALDAGKEFGIKIVPGVELSAKYDHRSIHILGYFMDASNQQLLDFLQTMQESRLKRAIKIVEKLQGKGISITLRDVRKHTGYGAIGRPHIASALVEKGAVKDFKSAFSRYLGDGKSCYVSKTNIPPVTVIQLILNAKGIPVLAHPSLSNIDACIEEFIDNGLLGIEVWCPSHSDDTVRKYLKIVKDHNLVATGGSDSHGTRENFPKIGDFTVPYEVVEKLENFYKGFF